MKSRNIDIIFLPQVGPIYRRTRRTPYVIRVHDLFPLTNPEWFRRIPRWNFRKSLNALTSRQKVLFLCNSEATKKSLIHAYPERLLNAIVYPCQVPKLNPARCLRCTACDSQKILESDYFLMVGTLEPRKDYSFILRAIERLESRVLPVVIVGRTGWKCRAVKREILRSEKVLWFRDACDGGLLALYMNATAFISTSVDEGFNIPAAEAHSLGIPLILRDNETHREFHEQNAKFFSSLEDLIELIGDTDSFSQKNVKRYDIAKSEFPISEILKFVKTTDVS